MHDLATAPDGSIPPTVAVRVDELSGPSGPEDVRDYRPRHGGGAVEPAGASAPASPDVGPRLPDLTDPLVRALDAALRSAAASVLGRPAEESAPGGRIRMTSPTGLDPLVVVDDGAGMSPVDVRALLNASVRGVDVFEALESAALLADDGRAHPLAATLRACLDVAEVVEIHSRPAGHPDAATMRVTVTTQGRARLSLAGVAVAESGTELRLHLAHRHRGTLLDTSLMSLVEPIAAGLAVAVSVDGTAVGPPAAEAHGSFWELGVDERVGWFARRAGQEPLAVLPLADGPGGLRATVAIPARAGALTDPHLVTRAGRAVSEPLVPQWAAFCDAVVDVPFASEPRDLGERGEERLRIHLGLSLVAALVRLEAEDPEVFAEVVRVHGEALGAVAEAHRDDMDRVLELLVVPTTAGPRSLADLRRMTSPVRCSRTDPTAPHRVGEPTGRLVVDARQPWVARMLGNVGDDGPGFDWS